MKIMRSFFMMLSMHLGCDIPLSLASEIRFLFQFSSITYNGNLFDHTTLKGVFDVFDKMKHLPSLPHFLLYFRHAQLDHEGQDRVNKLAKDGLLRLTR